MEGGVALEPFLTRLFAYGRMPAEVMEYPDLAELMIATALRPQMIRLAVECCDGIVLWLCTPRFVREQVTPHVERACSDFDKDPKEFQVITVLPTYTGEHADQAFTQFS